MPVATASLEAYGRMKSVKPKEHPVYKFLRTFGTSTAGYSNRQIAAIMGKPINTITPRIFELRQAGVVVLAGKRKDLFSGVEVSHWRIASEAEESTFKGLKDQAIVDEFKAIREQASEPRTWERLADIPEGVVVQENGTKFEGFGWFWIRRAGDEFGYRSASKLDNSFSAFTALVGEERNYGPVVEIIEVTA